MTFSINNKHPVIGIIGGSGLYKLDELKNIKQKNIKSLFGKPSSSVLFGTIEDIEIRFLPRHGINHTISPSLINYRANIDVLKRSGVTDIISVSAVGSLKEKYAPGAFVLIDQFIDKTFKRETSFFGDGCVAHVSMANPVSKELVKIIYESATQDIKLFKKGTYLAMEGPQFSTLAESKLYRKWGCDVIGMTNLPEAKLAREAELGYATIAMVTDYDCWHPEHEAVTVEQIISTMHANTEKVKKLLVNSIRSIYKKKWNWNNEIYKVLDTAIITPKSKRCKKLMKKLEAITKRVN